MYKIFEITYNDGGWHSGDLPHFFYIAKNKEDVVSNSQKYKKFLERKKLYGGDIRVHEVSGVLQESYFENLDDFNVEINIKKNEV